MTCDDVLSQLPRKIMQNITHDTNMATQTDKKQ